jgi:glycosyltransferase involved in cell wall biosynthesis
LQERKKHILILSSWYPTHEQPFLGNFVREQAKFLSRIYDVSVVHVVGTIDDNSFVIEERKEGKCTEILVRYPKKRWRLQRMIAKKRAYRLGFECIKSKVDLIHGHVLLPNLPFFAAAKENFDCPLIVTEHSSGFREGVSQLKWTEFWRLKRFLPKVDHLFAVSEFQQKDLTKIAGNVPLKVIQNPIDLHFFVPSGLKSNETFRFLHISTLDERTKNVQGILHAVSNLKKMELQPFELVILSDEPTGKWAQRCEAMDISDCVRFIGPCNPNEVLVALQQSHALVHFSNYESFSLVIAEAWACGIPVISTPVGIAEGMQLSLGLSVPIGDEQELSAAMVKLMGACTTFDGASIREYAKQFSVERYLLNYRLLIGDILR